MVYWNSSGCEPGRREKGITEVKAKDRARPKMIMKAISKGKITFCMGITSIIGFLRGDKLLRRAAVISYHFVIRVGPLSRTFHSLAQSRLRYAQHARGDSLITFGSPRRFSDQQGNGIFNRRQLLDFGK